MNVGFATLSPLHKSNRADFVEWDVYNWSKALDFWLAHTKQDISRCSALEVGARNGGLSLWLALQGARVLCSDIALPSSIALSQHQTYAVSHLIEYESIDATSIPYENRFDVIVFKSLLGGVGRGGRKDLQSKAVIEIHKALKKGGELFFAENLLGSPFHVFLRRLFVRWGRTWRYVSVSEMQEFMAPFSTVEYRTLGFSGAFARTETLRGVLGLLDDAVLNRVVPNSWRYIIAGVARK